MKTAQVQFNWIFVIVAGAVILAFFTGFAMKYIDLQNQRMSASVGRGIDNQLDSLSTSQLYTTIPLGLDIGIENDCKLFQVGTYTSAESNKIVFMPRKFRTSEIDAWVQPWAFPYTIENVFYLSSSSIKYYIIYNSNKLDMVSKLTGDNGVPKLFNIETITSTNDIKDIEKYQEVKVISLAGNVNVPENVKLVVVNGDENGIVTIDGTDYAYFGLPMLYGAIFSDDYGCMLTKAIEKMDEVTEVYSNKALYLWRADTKNCNYVLIKNSLDNLRTAIKQTPIDSNKVLALADSITNQNKELDGKGCAAVF